MANLFWSIWRGSFLQLIAPRQKLRTVHRNLAVGDFVMVHDQNNRRGGMEYRSRRESLPWSRWTYTSGWCQPTKCDLTSWDPATQSPRTGLIRSSRSSWTRFGGGWFGEISWQIGHHGYKNRSMTFLGEKIILNQGGFDKRDVMRASSAL